MITADSVSQLRRLMELRDERDTTKVAAEKAETAYRNAEADIYEALEENPIKGTIKIDLGEPWGVVSFAPRETYFGRIVDGEAAKTYYRERAMLDEVSEPKFAAKRINEEVRARKESGEKMPPGVDFYARRGVTITRQK